MKEPLAGDPTENHLVCLARLGTTVEVGLWHDLPVISGTEIFMCSA